MRSDNTYKTVPVALDMRVYFVVDIMNGLIVRAFRGVREGYRPISEFSRVVKSDDPMDVVEVVKPRFLYIADLDRIMGKGNNTRTIERLAERVEHLIADCGFRSPEELEGLRFTPVLGTETFDIERLEDVRIPAFVSLDLKEGKPINRDVELEELVELLNSFDLLGVIVLTLDRVGSCSLDFETVGMVVNLSENPVFAGGGVGSLEDLVKLKEMGCEGALIATAIHNGSIGLDVVRRGEV